MGHASTLADQLAAIQHNLPAKDREFAAGLIDSTRKHGETNGRVQWLQTLIARAQGAEQAPQQQTVSLGSFAKVKALFGCAKENLKFPKIRLQLESGQPVVLAIAGEASKAPGTINVTDGGPFGSNRWYGRVNDAGEWTKSGKEFPELAEVETLLHKLGEDPVATAGHYGRLTGRCCFCNLPLKDEQSTAVGFGPKCAQNYGLAGWRKEAATILERAAGAGA